MKIAQFTPGIIKIQKNNGWGAIEKIIYNLHETFRKMGHVCDIVDFSAPNLKDYDIVHSYMANQSLDLAKLNIPYFFTMCDHHTFIWGENSFVYKENLEAIQKSILTLFPAEFLISYFDFQQNTKFLPVGVDINLFTFKKRKIEKEPRLLCIANNGIIDKPFHDRKGFLLAIEAAKKLNLPITIVGPSNNNKNFFNHHKPNYDKLEIIYDVDEETMIKIIHEHDIFIHPSDIETGHPNMTMIEVLATGLPVVGTFWGGKQLKGLYRINRNIDDIIKGINEVIQNYEEYNINARKEGEEHSWDIICSKLLEVYYSYINNNYKFNPIITNTKEDYLNKINFIYNSNYFKAFPKTEIKEKTDESNISFNFHKGATINLHYVPNETKVEFFDNDTNQLLYQTNLGNNCWAKTEIKYYINYKVRATDNKTKQILLNHNFDCKNKKVLIYLDSYALGDTVAWFPYINEFAEKTGAKVIASTFHNYLFEKEYPNLEFVEPGTVIYDLYALYEIGIFDPNNKFHHRNDPRTVSLQQIASDALGLEYKEIKPKISLLNNKRLCKERYVCIFTESTAKAKLWNNEKGWQEVVDYLNLKEYKVVSIRKEGLSGLKNTIEINNKELKDLIGYINNSEFVIGLGSGMSWLSWALNKKVILISGFSEPWCEFYTPFRVINKKVCHGCFNNPKHQFDRSWEWCPENKNYECTKNINSELVIEEINKIIN